MCRSLLKKKEKHSNYKNQRKGLGTRAKTLMTSAIRPDVLYSVSPKKCPYPNFGLFLKIKTQSISCYYLANIYLDICSPANFKVKTL